MKDSIAELVKKGFVVQYKHVTICNLQFYLQTAGTIVRRFQVHSDNLKFSQLYNNIDDAVKQFLFLKNKI